MLRSELTAWIWGEDHHLEDDCAINTAVRKLRTALSDNAEKPRFIETVTGKGYRFVAAMRTQSRPGEAGQPGPAPSIAVLPFENLSPDSENEVYAMTLSSTGQANRNTGNEQAACELFSKARDLYRKLGYSQSDVRWSRVVDVEQALATCAR